MSHLGAPNLGNTGDCKVTNHAQNGSEQIGPPIRTTTEYRESRKREMKIFASRLYRLMIKKGWSQAELARQTKLHDPRPGKPGIGRDMIGGYVRALHLPEPPYVKILAATFGVEPEELLPTVSEVSELDARREARQAPPPPLEMTMTGTGRAMLHVNLELPLAVAVEVLALIQGAGAAEREGSRSE